MTIATEELRICRALLGGWNVREGDRHVAGTFYVFEEAEGFIRRARQAAAHDAQPALSGTGHLFTNRKGNR